MKLSAMAFPCLGLGLGMSFTAALAGTADLEKCYQKHGQVERTRDGGKEVETYKDSAQVAGDCNAKILARAQAEKDEAEVKALAGVIGRNSNWGSAMPVFTVLAKRNPKTACGDENALYGLADALSRPGTDKIATEAVTFLSTCWPNGKEEFVKLLTSGQNDYAKTNLCQFLKSKDAIPNRRKALCKKALAS
jgi:hypothetical protein